jgi:hypothetical protein
MLGIAGEIEVGTQVAASHGPPLRAVRRQAGQLAHGCDPGSGVRDGLREAQSLLVAVSIVGLGRASQERDHLSR